MFKRFNNLNLGHKINLGFAALVLILLLVVGLIFVAGRAATEQINLTVDVRVPTTLAAASAQSNLLKMQAAVRGYLAVGDLQNIDDYNQAKERFQENLAQLKVLSVDWADQDDIARLDRLIAIFAVWLSTPEKLFALHDNPLDNQPALRLETIETQPLNVALLDDVDLLITRLQNQYTRDQAAGSEQTAQVNQTLRELAGFRTALEGMSTNLSAYAATGDLIFKFRYSAALVTNSTHFGWLVANAPDELLNELAAESFNTPRAPRAEIEARFARIAQTRAKILDLSKQIFAAVEGEQSHLALYLFKHEMEPETEQMITLLETLVLGQQALLQTELNDGTRSLADLRYQTLLGGFMVLFLGAAMVYIFRRNIAKPIHRLSRTAERIGAGDLMAQATVETDDEIGHLATSFNHMTSQLRATFQALAQAKETAETANRAKSKFLASMSHELRTPLNGILGYVQILQRSDALNPPQQNALNVIQSNGEHLLGFINDILDLSKIEASKLELLPTQLTLPTFLVEIVQMYQSRALAHDGVDFVAAISPTLPTTIDADEMRLRQILLNLLENAFKFTAAGRVTFAVDLIAPTVPARVNPTQPGLTPPSLTPPDLTLPTTNRRTCAELRPTARLRFVISDTGIGMEAQALDTIFRPFEQVGDSQQRAKGTGLGLAITQELVYAMDAELRVESTPAVGSSFCFEGEFPASWGDSSEHGDWVAARANGCHIEHAADGKPLPITLEAVKTDRSAPPIDRLPPADELAIMLDMARKGELPKLQKRVTNLAASDPQYQSFATTLCKLIAAYEEEQIVAILQRHNQ